MIRTLYGKLTFALFGLLAFTGVLFMVISLWTTQRYIEEVNQKLHIDVADHLVKEVILIKDGEVNREGLDHIFHMMMVINPGIEIYLLDRAGKILAFSAPPGRVKAKTVSLAPIEQFLSEQPPSLPFTGDDPRFPGRRRAFSAAKIGHQGQTQGYLYVVLGGERYSSVVQLLAASHILRLGAIALIGSLLLAGIVGLIAFRMLTQRLRRLRAAMDDFESSQFARPVDLDEFSGKINGDELDDLGATFDRLAWAMTRQLQRARSADVLRRQLVANVSHDLRTPLASLTAYLETLLLKAPQLSETDRRRYIEVAYRHSQALEELVAKLFELAKLEAKETHPKPEAFALGELVQDIAQKFELRARQQGVRINTMIPRDLPFVYADLRLVERVLDNLIDNALRHTTQGHVTIALIPAPQRVVLEVSDTGQGIPPDDLPYIFDRFYRAKSSTADPSRGSGLGLAIAQRIAQLHGSRIDVRSQLGQGTQFSLTLRMPPTVTPLDPRHEQTSAPAMEHQSLEHRRLDPHTVSDPA